MNFDNLKAILASLLELGEERATQLVMTELAEITRQRASLSPDEDEVARDAFRCDFLEKLHESRFCRYAYEQPRGYPGDFVTQEMIWLSRTNGQKHRYEGETPFGAMLNSITMNMHAAAANEERVLFLRRLTQESGAGRIASIGCGSCIELWETEAFTERSDLQFVLVDQDAGALDAARRAVSIPESRVRYVHDNVLRFILRSERTLRQFDLVYLFGLLDYFDASSARRIVKCLWPSVAAGGQLVVTNAHPANPSRLWMEYAIDWFLDYKTPEELLSLASQLSNCESKVTSDSVGVYQYLRMRRLDPVI